MEDFITIKQASELLKVNPETLRRWDRSGKFRSSRHPMNNYRVYSRKEVLSLVEDLQLEFQYSKRVEADDSPVYFKSEHGELYNMDAIEFLQVQPSNSADLIFADPPYNIKKAEWDTFKSQKEYVDWSLAWISESARVLKNTGSLFICGFSEILADVKWGASPMFKGCKWLVWYYRNKANLGQDWGRSHESILHFRKSKKYKFHIDEVRIPYNAHTLKYPKRTQSESSQYANGKKKKYEWEPNPLGAKPKDVLEIPTISNSSWEKYNHQTQKPVELLKKIILSTTDEGDTVIDPFGGSGSTYAVAEAFSRNWKGSELSEEYCEMISKRLLDEEHLERVRTNKDASDSSHRRVKLRNG